jgi:hypothetical protein
METVEGEIDELVVGSIDKSLDSIGRGFRSIFYWSLENRVGIKRHQISKNPEEFSKYLDKMFPTGASAVKDVISTQLCEDLNIPKISSDLAVLIRYAITAGPPIGR